ncbi:MULTISPECIES: hypothetical protein [unclassified Variovorax]|uniref:hypothetical protein n=1 Tax=unclassified Variovorax TaxID=663243 RepID=UPI001317A646|nr:MULTISPECIES: hypothetical protein [unclassified Variovorax]VTU42525.1 hypothetical protein SRS16P1_00291 [Variovorax sp. SRS16]VTU42547.1 hypothetical protein E5P1_00289 [Variovorax sp. PBL-E5]VTU43973.1 hypothetical protein H6P1_00640 [Variovorax sp. PBL-H6]
MTRDELIAELRAKGFKMQATASSRWMGALYFATAARTMFVLVRKRGVDVVVTPLKLEELLNEKGDASISLRREADWVAEYNFEESGTAVHQRVNDASHCFTQDQEIEPSFFQKAGLGRKESNERYRAEHDEAAQLFQAVSPGNGEPGYLEGGVWLHKDGRTEHRG